MPQVDELKFFVRDHRAIRALDFPNPPALANRLHRHLDRVVFRGALQRDRIGRKRWCMAPAHRSGVIDLERGRHGSSTFGAGSYCTRNGCQHMDDKDSFAQGALLVYVFASALFLTTLGDH